MFKLHIYFKVEQIFLQMDFIHPLQLVTGSLRDFTLKEKESVNN